MELRQLHYFIMTAHYLNFTRAAEALYISQPALSHQIIELERELKVQLFYRGHRSITLTDKGKDLLRYAEQITHTLDRISGLGTEEGGLQVRQLRMAFDNSEHPNGWREESRAVSSFLVHYPDVQVQASHISQSDCEAQVLKGDLDLAFILLRHNELPDASLSYRTFFPDYLVLLVRADMPVHTLEDAIHQMPLTMISGSTKAQARVLKSLSKAGLEPNLLFQSNILSCIIQAQAGRASMLMPMRNYLALGPNNLRVIPIPGDSVQLCRAMIWDPKNPNAALDAFHSHTRGIL